MKRTLIASILTLLASADNSVGSNISTADFTGSGATYAENVLLTSNLQPLQHGSEVRIGYFAGGLTPGLRTLLADPDKNTVLGALQNNFVPLGEGLDPDLGTQTAAAGPRIGQRTVAGMSQSNRLLGQITQVIPTADAANFFNPANINGVGAGTNLVLLIYDAPDAASAGELGIFSADNWLMPGNNLTNVTVNSVDINLPGEVIRGGFGPPESLILGRFGPAPNIVLESSAATIADGGVRDFGSVDVLSTSVVTFTIRNTGDADLTNLAVSKEGPNAGDFSVSELSGASIPVGTGTVTFTVTFAPGGSGSRSAALRIASNLPWGPNPFDINLTGVGIVSVPEIDTHPSSITVTRGQQAVFEVEATGWSLSYQWKKGDGVINGATGSTYTIPAALESNAGSYTVEVSNEGGSVTSEPAVLAVYVPPGFTQPPPHTTASQEQPLTLSAAVEGSGTLEWQWRKDGVNIPNAVSSSYTITNMQPWHIGNYSAVISNGTDSSISAEAAVRATPFPFNVWQGLVAYYPLNGAHSGNDFGPLELHAANQGTTAAGDFWGRSDGALRFVTAESDGLTTAGSALFNSAANFTWTVWVKTTGSYSVPSTRIISTEGPDGSGQPGFGLYANSNGKFGAGLNWGGGGQGFESNAVYAANVWRHLTATYDGSRLRLYVDGVQAGSRVYTGVTLTSDSPLCFGKYRIHSNGNTGGYFDGWLDDVRFYNRVLSTTDIVQLRASDDGMDDDNDGLGDAWEARHGFSAAANESSGDADGDGMTNRQEYLAGSNPVNAASNFNTPQLNEVPNLNVLNLTWSGSPARNYAVQTSPDLAEWQTLATLPGLAGPTSLVVEAPVRPARQFYKVVVVP